MGWGLGLALVLVLSSCAKTDAPQSDTQVAGEPASASTPPTGETYFSTDQVHEINVDLSDAEYQSMLTTYAETGDKEWLATTVTIDGTTYENAGLRLKGNSSLRKLVAAEKGIALAQQDEDAAQDGESATSTDPATVSWLIRLNKYVDGQAHLGRYDFAVRGNASESSLNEAVAVAFLEAAGLPAHRVAFTGFSIGEGAPILRLVSEVPDDALWNADWFEGGSTWKADSDGDWDYHGEDGAEYESLWKQRTGEDDMTPIVELMDFINNSSDEDFEAGLDSYLDTEQFATYLAAEALLGNFDTISGPGNNGYLHYEPTSGQMLIIPWDHDMAFGVGPGGMTERGVFDPGVGPGVEAPGTDERGDTADGEWERPLPPRDMPRGEMPTGERGEPDMGGRDMGEPGREPSMVGPGGGGNILETRFLASEEFAELYAQAYARLRTDLVESGYTLSVLNAYADLLLTEASDLISAESVESERAPIAAQLAADEGTPAR